MRITWRKDKERLNIAKHGLDFAKAAQIFADPLSRTDWDRFTDGEERWRTIGTIIVGRVIKIVVVVHIYPDPDDESWIHVIGLREATRHGRRQYEISRF